MWFDAHCLLVTTPLTEVKWEIILQLSSCFVQYLFYMADGIGFGGVGGGQRWSWWVVPTNIWVWYGVNLRDIGGEGRVLCGTISDTAVVNVRMIWVNTV